jgi:hypothetical protein
MRRRDFISLLGGMTTIAWPCAGLAQNVGRRRAIVLMGTADDVEAKDRAVALQQGLQKLGWTVGRDIQIDYLFAAGNAERLLAYANEAVASKPDILLAQTNSAAKALQSRRTRLPAPGRRRRARQCPPSTPRNSRGLAPAQLVLFWIGTHSAASGVGCRAASLARRAPPPAGGARAAAVAAMDRAARRSRRAVKPVPCWLTSSPAPSARVRMVRARVSPRKACKG